MQCGVRAPGRWACYKNKSLPSYPKRKRRPPPILTNAFGPLLEPRVKLVTILRKDLRKAILEEQVTIAAAALLKVLNLDRVTCFQIAAREKDDTAILRHHKLRRRRVARSDRCAFSTP